MSPLWKSRKTMQLKTNHKRPSPRHSDGCQSLAQGLIFCQHKFPKQPPNCNAIKGISALTSAVRKVSASMTVEAALVLPLFLLFFLNMGCAMELIRLHGNLELALCDIGNRMAVYGHILSDNGWNKGADWWEELEDIAFSYIYVKKEIVNYVGKNYLEESPMANGVDGLQFLESEIFDEDDYFEVIVTYKVAPFSEIGGFGSFRMANRYYGHLWNGYRIPGSDDESSKEDVVYVTENGVVYHEDRNCSHLTLSVREVGLQEAYNSRNDHGERYALCLMCRNEKYAGVVYITDDGNAIHYTRNCSGLKRTVYAIAMEEASAYNPCKRCTYKSITRQ